MKTIKTLLLVVAITFSSVLSASTDPTATETKTVTAEIGKLLKSPKFSLNEEVLTYVEIVLNNQNEMIVLSVDTDNYEIAHYIKNRLNYVQLSTKVKEGMETFIIPVRIKPGN